MSPRPNGLRHLWKARGRDGDGREIATCRRCRVHRTTLSTSADQFLYPSGERVRVTKSGGVPACLGLHLAGEQPKALEEPWINWVTRIAKGATATQDHAREMASALLARERERDSYIAANRQWREEVERLRKIARDGWESARLVAIEFGALATKRAADVALALIGGLGDRPKSFPVTNPESDAPDGSFVDGYERVGDRWESREWKAEFKAGRCSHERCPNTLVMYIGGDQWICLLHAVALGIDVSEANAGMGMGARR